MKARENPEGVAMNDPNQLEAPVRRVFIVDGCPMVRIGLRQVITQQRDLVVCAEAARPDEASALLEHARPDAVILGLSLRVGDGIALVKEIRSKYSKLPVLVFSSRHENVYATRLIGFGASGYIMKDATVDQLLEALRRVIAGDFYVSDRIASTLISKLAASGSAEINDSMDSLSARELEVLSLLGCGNTTRQVADILSLSVKTIDSHRQHIKKKLGLRSSAELIQYSILHG